MQRVAEQVVNENWPLVWEMFRSASQQSGWDLNKSELQGHGYEIVELEISDANSGLTVESTRIDTVN